MQNAKIIDADGHVLDRDTDIRAFMEEPYCRRQGSLLAKDKWDASMYGKLGMNITDVPTRLRDMDTEGIEVSVLFPTTGFAITQSPEKDYAAAYCRGYNDWIASVCKDLRGSVSSRFRMSRPQSPRSIVPLPSLAWPASLLPRSA